MWRHITVLKCTQNFYRYYMLFPQPYHAWEVNPQFIWMEKSLCLCERNTIFPASIKVTFYTFYLAAMLNCSTCISDLRCPGGLVTRTSIDCGTSLSVCPRPVDVFISYRRSTGSQLARLVHVYELEHELVLPIVTVETKRNYMYILLATTWRSVLFNR